MNSSTAQILRCNIHLTKYRVRVIEIPFRAPVHLPFGLIETRPSVWLTVYAEVDGLSAKGAAEGTSLPIQIPLYDDYSGNLSSNICMILESLKGDHFTIEEARRLIANTKLNGNYATARMTVETSLLDLVARSMNKTVYEALTGDALDMPLAIPYGKSITEIEYEDIVNAGLRAIANGALRLKFKLSLKNYSAVIRGIMNMRSIYPEISFMVDANGVFDAENPKHISILREVDKLNLMMIEEPVSRGGRLTGLTAHRALRQRLEFNTPIALDDSIITKEDARTALKDELGEIINLKPGRIGSFLDCIDIANMAQGLDKQIMVGGMFEATPGRTMTLTLAALCLHMGFTIPGDVSLPQERLVDDLTSTNLKLDSQYNVIFAPKLGWGYEL